MTVCWRSAAVTSTGAADRRLNRIARCRDAALVADVAGDAPTELYSLPGWHRSLCWHRRYGEQAPVTRYLARAPSERRWPGSSGWFASS